MTEVYLQAPFNGPGIMCFSLGACCRSTLVFKNDGDAQLNFCMTCQKNTFAIKYPNHALRNFAVFYENRNRKKWCGPESLPGDQVWNKMMPSIVMGNGSIFSVFLNPCCRNTVRVENNLLLFKFCEKCQSQNSLLLKKDYYQ